MKEFKRFLSSDGLKQKVEEWRVAAQAQEGSNLNYKFDRPLTDKVEGRGVEETHLLEITKEVLPSLIKKKKNGEKVKVLDIGAGAAIFTDQIRQLFPDSVRVFSTGLDKKTAVEYRKNNYPELNPKIHSDDLKWRSVLELSDFEEFDLIIDTCGEFFYILYEQPDVQSIRDKAIEYLTAVIKKLKKGGLASIIAVTGISFRSNPVSQEIINQLEREFNVKIHILPEGPILRIEKLND